MSLVGLFEKGEKPNDEIAEDSTPANKKKAAFKRKYQGSYLNYGFIAIGDSHSPSPLCLIGDDWQAIKMFKTASLHGDHAPCLKRRLWSFSKEKDTWTEEHKQLSEATTSSNVSALRASFLLANHIAKTRKSFSEELILPVAKDIYWDLLGQAEVQKGACVPLSGSTITRWTDEIAEDIEAQLSERINESTRLLSLPTFITRQQCLFLCDIYMFQENVHEDMLCALLLPSNTTAAELCKSWNDYISGKRHWSFCIGIHTNRADTMASWFHHSDQRGHFWMWVFTLSCIEKTWLAKKCHLNLTTFWRMQVKWSITLKYTSLTYICSCSSMRRWAEHTSSLIHRSEVAF